MKWYRGKPVEVAGLGRFHFENTVWDLMIEWPTLNIGTVVMALMVPANGCLNATIWYKASPSEIEVA